MAHRLKFWYSDGHFENPPSPYGRGWCLNIDGRRYLYTASSETGAEEPFQGALKKFPDYRVVCVADWSAIQEIAEADIPAIREQTIALRSELVMKQVESTDSDWPAGNNQKSPGPVRPDSNVIGTLAILALLALGGWILFQLLDSTGWVSHTVQSTITAQSNWMVGESKDCFSYTLDAKSAYALGKEPGYALSKVECDNGPGHDISITFWGQENQPGKWAALWRCTRSVDSFTCKQTGAF